MNEDETTLEPEEEEDERPRRRIQHVKKYEVMLAECDQYVMAGKRLPKLHSRWLYNRYVNCQTASMAGIGPHNRMVDELREAKKTMAQLRKALDEIGTAAASVLDEENIRDWDEGGRLGDALIGIKDIVATIYAEEKHERI